MSVLAECLLLLFAPVATGRLLARLIRWKRPRFRGVAALTASLLTPVCLAVSIAWMWPIVGVYDAALEGGLLGAGLAWGAHAAFARSIGVVTTLASFSLCLCGLELATRRLLPRPPGFPLQRPHLLLSDADRQRLRGGSAPPAGSMLPMGIVCSILYGTPAPDLSPHVDRQVPPARFSPKPDRKRRMLHIGDSMTFGLGAGDDETFEARLEALEPEWQHINAAIPGTAPDQYFAVLQQWLARVPVESVVMYLTEANDLDLDQRHFCSGWQSLLTYDSGSPMLRYPSGPLILTGGGRTSGLHIDSPPPFLVRALVGRSAIASYLAAATVEARTAELESDESDADRVEHLREIIRATDESLRAGHIHFTVVLLPYGPDLMRGQPRPHADMMLSAAREAGATVLDASEVIGEALRRGEQVLADDRLHYSATGNALLARWLHGKFTDDGNEAPSFSSKADSGSR